MFKKVLLVAKKDDNLACRARKALTEKLQKSGVAVEEPFLTEADSFSDDKVADLVICIGGDGTLLAALRKIGGLRHRAMVLGIHGSRGLGFLHPLAMPQAHEDAEEWARNIWGALESNQYVGETRWGLEATFDNEGRKHWALNDFVLGKATISRMVELGLSWGGNVIVPKMRGDGLIVSSATGSTAYSLSAGGPVLDPVLRALLVTPVCSHTLGLRPMVLNADHEIKLERFDSNTKGVLTADGQEAWDWEEGHSLEIRCSEEPIHFLKPMSEACRSPEYFEVLRSKLAFGKDRDAR